MRTRLMYHAACKVEFQPFKRLYSQLTFFNLKKKNLHKICVRAYSMFYPYEGYRSVTPLDAARVNRTILQHRRIIFCCAAFFGVAWPHWCELQN